MSDTTKIINEGEKHATEFLGNLFAYLEQEGADIAEKCQITAAVALHMMAASILHSKPKRENDLIYQYCRALKQAIDNKKKQGLDYPRSSWKYVQGCESN